MTFPQRAFQRVRVGVETFHPTRIRELAPPYPLVMMLSDDGTFLAEYNYIIDDDEGLVSGGIVFNYS